MTKQQMNRLIAEKCEGWVTMNCTNTNDPDTFFWEVPGEPVQYTKLLPDYFTDIAACVRAAEAWRKAMTSKGERYWIFESGLVPDDRPSVRLYWSGGKNMQMSFGDTLAAALAAALVEAVK